MFKLKLIPHSKLTKNYLNEIVFIKSKAWAYDYEKQLEWMKCNLNDSDIHVLLYSNNEPVAYLNLILVNLVFDEKIRVAFGVGNVCAREKGRGWGKELIYRTNTYLIETKKIGLLFCKIHLIDFYQECNWCVLKNEDIRLHFNNDSIYTLIFNCALSFFKIEYDGSPF